MTGNDESKQLYEIAEELQKALELIVRELPQLAGEQARAARLSAALDLVAKASTALTNASSSALGMSKSNGRGY